MNGVEQIAAERQRQIDVEGWSAEHDNKHLDGSMAMAAACYAAPGPIYLYGEYRKLLGYETHTMVGFHDPWPWAAKWDKRDKHDKLQRLVIAGALIAAEIDRLERAEMPTPDQIDWRR